MVYIHCRRNLLGGVREVISWSKQPFGQCFSTNLSSIQYFLYILFSGWKSSRQRTLWAYLRKPEHESQTGRIRLSEIHVDQHCEKTGRIPRRSNGKGQRPKLQIRHIEEARRVTGDRASNPIGYLSDRGEYQKALLEEVAEECNDLWHQVDFGLGLLHREAEQLHPEDYHYSCCTSGGKWGENLNHQLSRVNNMAW